MISDLKISLDKVGKRFGYSWLYRNIKLDIKSGESLAIQGPNGSGKSTLMKIISGYLTPSEGTCTYYLGSKKIDPDHIYKHVSFSGPYIDLIDEFTLEEHIRFHASLKPFRNGYSTTDIIDRLGFHSSKTHDQIRTFSSGMKQRIKLSLSILSDTPVCLLDEPTTNLDTQGVEWYLGLIKSNMSDRVVIIASNVDADHDFCEDRIRLEKKI